VEVRDAFVEVVIGDEDVGVVDAAVVDGEVDCVQLGAVVFLMVFFRHEFAAVECAVEAVVDRQVVQVGVFLHGHVGVVDECLVEQCAFGVEVGLADIRDADDGWCSHGSVPFFSWGGGLDEAGAADCSVGWMLLGDFLREFFGDVW
jgi:hypothetical protein